MATSLPPDLQMALNSPDPRAVLQLSQHTPSFLASHPAQQPSFPFSMFTTSETPELWLTYEQLFLACVRTGDDDSARQCLERLSKRFGPANERIMALKGVYEEALAKDRDAFEEILTGYEKVLKENPVNVPILKRRIGLLRSMSRPVDAISALVDFLDVFPTDAEAWCELADLYQAQGMSMQAIFCLEEALLVAPNAWNLHARLGEVEYISSTSSDNQEMTVRLLADSVRRFCRSIELCDDYLRGYYGLKLSTSRLLDKLSTKAATQLKGGDHNLPTQETLTKLQALSTKKLHEIVHSRSADIRCREMNQSELIAAQELLDREGK
ncbi:tetratricopeptide repeat domain-containing protein [Histoplasma capsulatum G186AR]|nr:tetratricopeptide repeat domain-containing protein [Histoplasma capsulatum]QSS70959.1 tetratricopeptide repeat domain-containing protein [Histoplasma capsulatum G186AR]